MSVLKIVGPILGSTGALTGGGLIATSFVYPELLKPLKEKMSSSELGNNGFEFSLAEGSSQVHKLECSFPNSEGKHYTVTLWREGPNKAEVHCELSDSPQSGYYLRPLVRADETKESQPDRKITDPIDGLSCQPYRNKRDQRINVFVCSGPKNRRSEARSELYGLRAPKLVFEIKD
ncbi:hypothetical protein MHLP_00855 [Candidatus Mycoplasma haematolamae str. Purdue]|uniref:Uncharacterized protein n=1 Tax=Mycoplasma haematolamae (strain Purdue) TaxID=1212765 RepID=I7CES4_MYCHA|nr:hypothetical protein [Candidatus Mycoplasma haematolamae]AFO51751.1 hypothetical protein MHLP_00855 [Candidatus Mycoplasma haematolamae str. Purdue]